MTKKGKSDDPIHVTTIHEGTLALVLIGRTPLILNRMSEKAKHELLMPKGRKTAAEKAANLKHNPYQEFAAAAHRFPPEEVDSPSLLRIPAAAPKRALASAALDMPGAKKAQIGRLAWVPGEYLPVYGIPKLLMSIVRNSDMNHTPDVRTRVIVPEWMIPLTVNFAMPLLNVTVITNLLTASGFYIGVGDWRNEKGAGNYGQYDVLPVVAAVKDSRYQALLKAGRKEQEAAMNAPEPYDIETRELLEWFDDEVKVRGKAA